MDAVTSFLGGLSATVSISIVLDCTPHRKTVTLKRGKHDTCQLPVYFGNDDISGSISIEIKNSTKYEHMGLKCFLIGRLQIYERSELSTEFTSLSKELEPAGYLTGSKTYKFKFGNFDKEYETFKGNAGHVQYLIRVALNRNIIGPVTEDCEFAVIKASQLPKSEIPTKMEVGVDDHLHIEFQFNKSCYSMKETVEGVVKFYKIRMAISRMELALVRRQTLGTNDSTQSQTKTLVSYQVMDGCPEQGETVPIRMNLRGVKNLCPSYKSIHNRLFVRHWLNLILFDEQGRRYFKQTEIVIYRKA